MQGHILDRLAVLTDEEKSFLEHKGMITLITFDGQRSFVDREKMLQKGQMITIWPHARFMAYPEHSHDFVEIMYMCSGQTVHHFLGQETVTLVAGELLIMNQHARHGIERADEGDIAINIIVLPQFFDLAFDMIGPDNVLGRFLLGILSNDASDANYLHFKVADVLAIQNLMENMTWGFLSNEPNFRRLSQATMALLFLQLLNHTQDLAVPKKGNHAHALVVRVLREIEENYPDVCLTDLAKQYRVSLSHMSSIIKEHTGSTFKELLQQKRLDKAAKLLRESRLSTEDIISAVGYCNTSHFYRAFRKRFGTTPYSYRKHVETN